MRRRDFIRNGIFAAAALKAGAAHAAPAPPGFHEARWYEKGAGGAVSCRLCPRGCVLGEGELSFCRGRKNIGGKLYSLGYGTPCAVHVDPIEKKPFANYLPRSLSFSIASAGCSLRCKFCQNWEISQISPLDARNYTLPPQDIPGRAKDAGCLTVAYTYSEPTSFFEYMADTAKAVRKAGLRNVYHSNGFINPEPLKELCGLIDAANIDLKGFSEKFYSEVSEAELAPVLRTLKALKKAGVWLEITNLVIPGYNDDMGMIKKMCGWIREELGPETPLHFSRFHPLYKMNRVPPTPVGTLDKAHETAKKAGLQFAYVGNVWGHPGESTYCPHCKKTLIARTGYTTREYNVKGNKCGFCGKKVAGVWG